MFPPFTADLLSTVYGRFGTDTYSTTGWVVVGIIWIFCSLFGVGLFPVFEGRKTLVNTVKFIFLDITGKKHPKKIHNMAIEGDVAETSEGKDPQVLRSKESPGEVTPAEK